MGSRVTEGHGILSSSYPPQCKLLLFHDTMTEFLPLCFSSESGSSGPYRTEDAAGEEESVHQEHIIQGRAKMAAREDVEFMSPHD